jgi:hypothetical protein
VLFKYDNTMVADSDDYMGINATAKCGCSQTNSSCGANNQQNMGTQSASQCGANHTAQNSATYVTNK